MFQTFQIRNNACIQEMHAQSVNNNNNNNNNYTFLSPITTPSQILFPNANTNNISKCNIPSSNNSNSNFIVVVLNNNNNNNTINNYNSCSFNSGCRSQLFYSEEKKKCEMQKENKNIHNYNRDLIPSKPILCSTFNNNINNNNIKPHKNTNDKDTNDLLRVEKSTENGGNITTSWVSFTKHNKQLHSILNKNNVYFPIPQNEKKPWKCPICDKRYTHKRSLIIHFRMHTKYAFACKICTKAFPAERNLTEHIRIHTGEKPFACNTCRRRFTQRHSLNDHVRIHTGEKPFQCHICHQSFRVKNKLNNHLRKKHAI